MGKTLPHRYGTFSLGMQSFKDKAHELGYSFSLKYFKCKSSFHSISARHWIYCFSLFLYFHLFLSSFPLTIIHQPFGPDACYSRCVCGPCGWNSCCCRRWGRSSHAHPCCWWHRANRWVTTVHEHICVCENFSPWWVRVCVLASECLFYWFEEPHRASYAGYAPDDASSDQCWVFWIGIGVAMEIAICVARAIVFEHGSSVLQEPQADVDLLNVQ